MWSDSYTEGCLEGELNEFYESYLSYGFDFEFSELLISLYIYL